MLPEPIALAFANTRSSAERDRIATLGAWRVWIDAWPGLRAAGRRVGERDLSALRRLRDDAQMLLLARATGERPHAAAAGRVAELARSASSFEIRWSSGRPSLSVPAGVRPFTALARHLAGATLDLLISGPPLRHCAGRDCLRIFVASRADRRWCDSGVCGNRARVRAHTARRTVRSDALDR